MNPYVSPGAPGVPFDPYASPAQQAPIYPSPYPTPYPVYPASPYGQPIPYAPYGGPPLNDMIADMQWNRRVWGQFDYLAWWAKGNPLPALVTTSPLGTPLGSAGVLPEGPSTSILFGNQLIDTQCAAVVGFSLAIGCLRMNAGASKGSILALAPSARISTPIPLSLRSWPGRSRTSAAARPCRKRR